MGDDYPARVYVIVQDRLAFWRLRSINYVWASTSPQGKRWPSAFAGNSVVMIAQRSGPSGIGTWHQEKRNVRADIQQYFGDGITYLDAVPHGETASGTADDLLPALADFVLVKPFCAGWFAVQARETRHRIFGQPSATQMTVALLVFWPIAAGLAARLESRNRRAVRGAPGTFCEWTSFTCANLLRSARLTMAS